MNDELIDRLAELLEPGPLPTKDDFWEQFPDKSKAELDRMVAREAVVEALAMHSLIRRIRALVGVTEQNPAADKSLWPNSFSDMFCHMPLNLSHIRNLARRSGKSQRELAALLGMKQPNLAAILAGNTPNVTIATIDNLAKVLRVSAKQLIK